MTVVHIFLYNAVNRDRDLFAPLQHVPSSSNARPEGDSMPNEPQVTRKLSAIFSADVKGYSLLMSDDEVHTIATLKAYRQIMSESIQHHSGRVVDTPGDNILAEFKSVVDAVQCS